MMLFGHSIQAGSSDSLKDQVRDILRREIQNGRWTVGERLPTDRELSRMSELSTSPITQAVSALVEEGYLFRHVGRGTFLKSAKPLDRRRSGVIGIVYSGASPGFKTTASEAFDRDLIIATSEHLQTVGFSVKVFHESSLSIKARKPERIFATSPFRDLDGILNVGPVENHVLAQAQGLNIPMVGLGDPHPPEGVPFVAGGIQQAVWEAVDMLCRAGHTKIGLAHTQAGIPLRTRRLRYEAFYGACAANKVNPKEEWVLDVGPRYAIGIEQVRDFLLSPGRPTALVCTHNHAAQVICDIGRLLDVKIPDELSVLLITGTVDFGDTFNPPLSTLVISTVDYARKAANALVEMIDRGQVQGDGGVLIRPIKMMRSSIAAPFTWEPALAVGKPK